MKSLPPASLEETANLADPDFRFGQMLGSVQALSSNGTLWYSLLNMIAAYIDGLASGPKGGTKAAYISYLETHFPALVAELGAIAFYENYRNAAIHEFGLSQGYAIGRDIGLNGSYVAAQTIKETGESVLVLNIDRLASDFLAHVEHLRQNAVGKLAL